MGQAGVLKRLVAKAICMVKDAPKHVPMKAGYYAIFIDKACSLPNPFRDHLVQHATRLIYIGIAKRSLHKRLVEQDLRHQQPSTFFRGVGAILGYRPLFGSLAGMANQNNYRFSQTDTDKITIWMQEHLSISWVTVKRALPQIERSLIRAHSPIINTTHNLHPIAELAALRRECRAIARRDAASLSTRGRSSG